EAARAIEVLANRPLGRLPLIVADGSVIEYGVARDMRQRIRARDVPAPFADESDELRLIVKLIRAVRPDHRRIVTDKRGRRAEEYHRIFRRLGAASRRLVD